MTAQAKVFLEIAERTDNIDESAMTYAILKNSLEGQEEHNRRIIEDLSIENPFPYLKCDWHRVKSDYYSNRTNGTRLPATVKN